MVKSTDYNNSDINQGIYKDIRCPIKLLLLYLKRDNFDKYSSFTFQTVEIQNYVKYMYVAGRDKAAPMSEISKLS